MGIIYMTTYLLDFAHTIVLAMYLTTPGVVMYNKKVEKIGGSKNAGETNMKIQDAILRLERAGSEYSRTSQKLKQAVVETANLICKTLDASTVDASLKEKINNGHSLVHLDLIDSKTFAAMSDQEKAKWGGISSYYYDRGRNGSISYLYTGDPTEPGNEILNASDLGSISRDNALMFSRHIANGMLDLLSAWLERRAENAERASLKLEAK